MIATEHLSLRFQPVADDADTAMFTGRGKREDGAFEAVENMGCPMHYHFK
jgi:hypothetical protein